MLAKRVRGVLPWIRRGSTVEILIALLVIVTPFLTEVELVGLLASLLVGVLVLGICLWDAWAERHDRADRVADPTWLTLLGGLWLMIYPSFLDASTAYVLANAALGGGLILSGTYVIVLSNRLRVRGRVARQEKLEG